MRIFERKKNVLNFTKCIGISNFEVGLFEKYTTQKKKQS